MLALKITDVKDFMNKLLIGEVFVSNLKKYLNDLLVFYTEYFEHPYHV